MTLLCRLHSEVHKFGLNEVADRLREIVESQSQIQSQEYHDRLMVCAYLLENLVTAASKLEDMEIK